MSSVKENGEQPHSMTGLVKSEPQDISVLQSSSSLNRTPSEGSFTRVKTEPAPYAYASILQAATSFANALATSSAAETSGAKSERDATMLDRHQHAFKVYSNAAEIDYSPESCLEEGKKMVQSLETGMKQLKFSSKLRQDVWLRELTSLQSQTSPKTLIAVCGATGAGKSSILNAILDDNIVPTSGMRACTAVVTEIAYHDKRTIAGDVSFLSTQEWKDELSILLLDLVDEDGTVRRSTDLKSDAGIAWQKVHAVYPRLAQDRLVRMTADQIIAFDPNIAAILGTTKKIEAKNSKAFAEQIGKYIDSKDQSRGKKKDKKSKDTEKEKERPMGSLMDKVRAAAAGTSKKSKPSDQKNTSEDSGPAFWPLIRQVTVRCNSPALASGAILVDLPGVADANAARNSIAKDYMKKCACIWILAPITRAVDDKTARDLLGDAFKLQLMNGAYDDHTITFIASKCDDISCSEVIRALNLHDDPTLENLEEQIETNEEETAALKQVKKDSEKVIKSTTSKLEALRKILKEYKAHLEALENGEPFEPKLTAKKSKSSQAGKKRKNRRGGKKGSPKRSRSESVDGSDDESDQDDSDSDIDQASDDDAGFDVDSDSDAAGDDENEEEDVVTEDFIQSKITETEAAIKDVRASQAEPKQTKKDAMSAISTNAKALAKLQREKNAFCSLKRSEFSRDVLKEDFRTGLKDLDDAAAENRDPENFDPTKDIRDYEKINLPVFTCSSRDYVRIKGQVSGDGEPTCFSKVDDTGIPSLQQWCHTLTLASRQRGARQFSKQLKHFATSVKTYVQGIGEVTAADRESLRAQWESSPIDDGGSDATSQAWDENADPFAAIEDGGNMYKIKSDLPKVDPWGEPIGVAPRLVKEFTTIIVKNVEGIQTRFKDGLESKCREGSTSAASSAVKTSDEFASSMHWASYRATLRRHGEYRRDLNAELLAPFTKNIASSWSKVFETDLFAQLHDDVVAAINALVALVEESAAAGLKDRTRVQGELCIGEAETALKKAVEAVKIAMQEEQKEISRCLAPQVQAHLVDGYDRAMEERGTGSVARQKNVFREYVMEEKDTMFEDGADTVLGRLDSAAASTGTALAESLGHLAQQVEVNMAVLWEEWDKTNDHKQVAARTQLVSVAAEVIEQMVHWAGAEVTSRMAALEDGDVEMS